MVSQRLSCICLRLRHRLAVLLYPQIRQLESFRFDRLTGANVRAVYEDFKDTPRAKALHVILFDLDDFKEINDNGGYALGDLALEYLAAAVKYICEQNQLPFKERFYRMGGDEFLLYVEPDIIQQVGREVLFQVIGPKRQPKFRDLPWIMISYGIGREVREANADLHGVKIIDRCKVGRDRRQAA